MRSLGYIRVSNAPLLLLATITEDVLQAKVTETSTLIGSVSATGPDADTAVRVDDERLSNGKIDGPSVILAYMGDEKNYVSVLILAIRYRQYPYYGFP